MTLFSLRSLAVAALCLAALPAFAQAADTPFRLQTTLDAPDWLKISGSIRPRYESLHNQFNAGRTGDDEFLGVQSLLKVEAGRDFIVGGEILDARRIIGDAAGSSAGEIDALEPLQLYAAWRPADFLMDGARTDLTLGRFTMDLGSRRLAARSGMRNVLAAFDGVRGVWTSPTGVKLTGFLTAPVNRTPSDVPSALDNDIEFNEQADTTRFSGWHVEAPIIHAVNGEVYLFDLDEDDGADFATRNRDLVTVGARLKRAPKANTWDIDLEYAKQTGSVHATASPADITPLDQDASMLHAEAGWTFDAPWRPRVSLHWDYVSGDSSPADLSSERFDPLFGDRAFELGPTSTWAMILRSNLDSPGVRLELRPDGRNEVVAMVRDVKLDSETDSFANTGVRDITGASGKNVGTHLELRWRHQIIPDSLRLAIGGAALLRGSFFRNAPNATQLGDSHFAYTELTFTF